MTCTYLIGQDFTCNEPAEGAYCAHHTTRRCAGCHGPATHNCQHIKTSICGHALCDE